MELKVFKDTLAAYGGRWETRQELPVETEILIPDYQPAVFKIVKCLMQPVVLQKQLLCRRTVLSSTLATADTCTRHRP